MQIDPVSLGVALGAVVAVVGRACCSSPGASGRRMRSCWPACCWRRRLDANPTICDCDPVAKHTSSYPDGEISRGRNDQPCQPLLIAPLVSGSSR